MQKWAMAVVKWPEEFGGFNLLGVLMNGFIYIEIGGTGGSAFRSMYAKFLEEASTVMNKPALKEIAEMIWESATVWNEIASRLLPDSWLNLARMRQLMFEKNRIFEEQEPGALDAMNRINGELDELMVKGVEDLRRQPIFLSDVQQSILKCHEIENRAFEALNSIVGI